jgi:hypothetical protein
VRFRFLLRDKENVVLKFKKEFVMSKPIAVTAIEFEKTVLQSEVPVAPAHVIKSKTDALLHAVSA